ncbi:hypothetical protein C4K01_0345 [Pseudomonas synxantha]|nr:hypothetical protein C4K01_0345 [Pseudomonas synxantha]
MTHVGGGLPPIAAGQSSDLLADTPQSGASPLPHWIGGNTQDNPSEVEPHGCE